MGIRHLSELMLIVLKSIKLYLNGEYYHFPSSLFEGYKVVLLKAAKVAKAAKVGFLHVLWLALVIEAPTWQQQQK